MLRATPTLVLFPASRLKAVGDCSASDHHRGVPSSTTARESILPAEIRSPEARGPSVWDNTRIEVLAHIFH